MVSLSASHLPAAVVEEESVQPSKQHSPSDVSASEPPKSTTPHPKTTVLHISEEKAEVRLPHTIGIPLWNVIVDGRWPDNVSMLPGFTLTCVSLH